MRKLSIIITLALVMTFGSAFAQTSTVRLGNVTNEISPTELFADSTITLDFIYEAGDAPTTNKYIYSNNFILHGDADWGALTSTRLTLAQLALVESGVMHFGTTVFHRWWAKTGGTGDPNFGAPGSGTDEVGISAGPMPGNVSGTDTIGVLYALAATSADHGWDMVAHGDGPRYQWQFTTSAADIGEFICVDTVSQPLGSWEWSSGVVLINPLYDNGNGGDGDRCWEVTTLTSITPLSDLGVPVDFALEQNYPNPFNPTTNIKFDVPKRTNVNISVFNVLGQKVRTLVDQDFAPGSYEVDWAGDSDSGSKVASGIYFYKFVAEDVVKTRKMLMLK